MVHPPPTNILAQHLQRGMSKSNNTTLRNNIQMKQGIQQLSTSIYPSSSNPSQQVVSNASTPKGNQNITVGVKTNMTSPPIVSTTTLSLISSSGFVASNSGGDSSIYSMPGTQHLLPINNQTGVGMLSSTSVSSNSGQLQNQQTSGNPGRAPIVMMFAQCNAC